MPAAVKSERRWARRKDARPEEITAAALESFIERGYAATRLEDVAARAGISKGTLYLYFAICRLSLSPRAHSQFHSLIFSVPSVPPCLPQSLDHHTSTRSSGLRYIASSAFTSNAS